jgi:phage terminase large subunit
LTAQNQRKRTVDFWGPFKDLGKASRYKVYYGGRGSGKSWQFARWLLIKAAQKPIRVLCAREIQRSIADSVHRLLTDQINALGLAHIFEAQVSYIKAKNGSVFLFEGLYSNVTKIKSMEGIDYCWVEEAESVTPQSWDLLIPTIRKPGSEIWISFNPQRDDDETYKRFVLSPPPDAIVKEVSYNDNPHFPEVLLREMEDCKARNYSKYMHIWEGKPITDYSSLVYRWRDDVNEAPAPIEYNPGLETYCSWDFGVSDDTAIIWWQVAQVPKSEQCPDGIMIYVIDEYISNNQPAEHYRRIVQDKPYRVRLHYCDPSGASRDSSLESWVSKLGFEFEYSSAWSIAEMVDRANDLMPVVRVNRQQCPRVWRMFRSWQYKTDKDGKMVLPPRPNHDEYSHPGTAFYYGLAFRFPPEDAGGRAYIY